MAESQKPLCAARSAGVACKNAGTREHVEVHDMHERMWFFLCDEHQRAWEAGELALERLNPERVTTYIE